jgi:hypothetical protein
MGTGRLAGGPHECRLPVPSALAHRPAKNLRVSFVSVANNDVALVSVGLP